MGEWSTVIYNKYINIYQQSSHSPIPCWAPVRELKPGTGRSRPALPRGSMMPCGKGLRRAAGQLLCPTCSVKLGWNQWGFPWVISNSWMVYDGKSYNGWWIWWTWGTPHFRKPSNGLGLVIDCLFPRFDVLSRILETVWPGLQMRFATSQLWHNSICFSLSLAAGLQLLPVQMYMRIGRCWIWQRWVTAFGTMALVKTGYVPLSWPPSACSASVELQIAADWEHVLQVTDVFVIAVFGCLWQCSYRNPPEDKHLISFAQSSDLAVCCAGCWSTFALGTWLEVTQLQVMSCSFCFESRLKGHCCWHCRSRRSTSYTLLFDVFCIFYTENTVVWGFLTSYSVMPLIQRLRIWLNMEGTTWRLLHFLGECRWGSHPSSGA